MKLLILGGTVFLGRALVEAAQAAGHEVTLFNRGKSNPSLFPGIEKLVGDRKEDVSALQGRRWDAAIDTSGYVPRVVRLSAEALMQSVDHYTFISSLSVYADPSRPGLDENAPLATMSDEKVEEVTGETYGPLKVLSEQAAEEALPGRVLVIRPGLIVGPHDPTDRFTYWPYRVARGGEVLAPGRPARPVQFIDVRDLAEWTVRMVGARRTGVYNADGPEEPLSMGSLLEYCKEVSGSDARFTWVSEEFLAEHDVEPWTGLPLWLPESDPAYAGFFAFNIDRAVRDGLTFRPVADTVRATLDWVRTRPEDHSWRAGLPPEREAELLRAWHQQAEGLTGGKDSS